MSAQEYEIAVVVLGSPESGKTSFISSLLAGLKADRIGEQTYRLERPTRVVILHVLENDLVAFAQAPFPACAFLCYDMGDRESLATLRQYWHRQFLLRKPADAELTPVMLLGLKRDLRDLNPSTAVDTHAAIKEGQEMRVAHYGECSAKTGQFMKLVAEDFLAMVKACIARQTQDAQSYCTMM